MSHIVVIESHIGKWNLHRASQTPLKPSLPVKCSTCFHVALLPVSPCRWRASVLGPCGQYAITQIELKNK